MACGGAAAASSARADLMAAASARAQTSAVSNSKPAASASARMASICVSRSASTRTLSVRVLIWLRGLRIAMVMLLSVG